jgi:isoquinoline 1-oxidoreductase subunit beta
MGNVHSVQVDGKTPLPDPVRRSIGGGLLLSFCLPFGCSKAPSSEVAPNACIWIGGDGQVVLIMPYVEMGQGTCTSLPILIAEELDVPLKRVRLVHAPPNQKLYANPMVGAQATGSSNAIGGAWKPLRHAGAAARIMLVAAAARRWNVDAKCCRAQDGEVIHVPSGKRLSYGELAVDAATMPTREKTMQKLEEFKLISAPMKRLDTPARPTGRRPAASMSNVREAPYDIRIGVDPNTLTQSA